MTLKLKNRKCIQQKKMFLAMFCCYMFTVVNNQLLYVTVINNQLNLKVKTATLFGFLCVIILHIIKRKYLNFGVKL